MLIVAVLPNFLLSRGISPFYICVGGYPHPAFIRVIRLRQVGAAQRQGIQAEFLVEILVRIYSTSPRND
jgi:hypothetical protein